jgi:hypothetical protein
VTSSGRQYRLELRNARFRPPSQDALNRAKLNRDACESLKQRIVKFLLGRLFLARRLRMANQTMFDDLARAVGHGAATRATAAERR